MDEKRLEAFESEERYNETDSRISATIKMMMMIACRHQRNHPKKIIQPTNTTTSSTCFTTTNTKSSVSPQKQTTRRKTNCLMQKQQQQAARRICATPTEQRLNGGSDTGNLFRLGALVALLAALSMAGSSSGAQAPTCGYPGSPAHASVTFNTSHVVAGTAASYTCDNGYELLGPPRRLCQSNGTWAPIGIPFCGKYSTLGLKVCLQFRSNIFPS